MTATNHALTGAVIALLVKKPELAIPMAFLSHFATDAVPHYNPKNITAHGFSNMFETWSKKTASPLFVAIFVADMLLLVATLLVLPFVFRHPNISAWTIFFSSLVAILPDVISHRYIAYKVLGIKVKDITQDSALMRFHNWLQWMDRPWGIWVELAWFALMVWLIHNLTR